MARGRERGRKRSHGPRGQLLVALLAVLAGAIAGATASPRVSDVAGAADPDRSRGEQSELPDGDAPAAERRSAPRTLLTAHTGAGGRVDLMWLTAVAEGGDDAAVVLVPTLTLVEVPSLGIQTLADVPRMSSPEALHTTVENSLGIRVDDMVVLDDDAITALLEPATRIAVELRRPVRVDDDAGTVALNPGSQEIDAASAMRVLTARGDDGELARLVTVQAVLDGWRIALRDAAVRDATLEVEPAFGTFAATAAASVRYDTLPVSVVSTAAEERFGLRDDDVAKLLERVMPWARYGDGGPRPRIEILNGTGGIGVTQSVTARIVTIGAEVTLTGNVPGFGVQETKVVYYRDGGEVVARRLVEALGAGQVARAAEPIGVVDATIIVGADLPLVNP